MKKISSIIIVGIFFCVLLLPHVADRLVKIEHSAIDENRNLTPFPTKIKYRNIAKQLEEYYNDRIPFRTILLKGCRDLQSKLFAFTPGNVLPGKNDFLFFRKPGWEDPLEEGMAAHSSVLAWSIPWTEQPVRLQSIGWQRVRHD